MSSEDYSGEGVMEIQSPPKLTRDQGDGAAIPSKSINEKESQPSTTSSDDEALPSAGRKLMFSLQLDAAQVCLFLVALATRFWRLGYPRAIVFDEILFGRFAQFYLKNLFYFDVNPPFGSQIYAWFGQLFGMGDCNDFAFDQIGKEYPAQFPVWQMRALPALCGSLLVPCAYQLILELGLSQPAAVFAGFLIIFDNALTIQSRFILLEPIILLACCVALVSLLKFRKASSFTVEWWAWLLLSGISSMCAFSVKFVGGYTLILILSIVVVDYWALLSDMTASCIDLVRHLLARVACLVVIPVAVYVTVMYVHLSILTKAGPGDTKMTSAFQASLEGGLALITNNQPYEVAYGSQITLRRSFGNDPCWLHSHDHVYPTKYEDGRGSSHQQQVTCYIFKDTNNWWVIKHPDSEKLHVDVPPKPVKHGDVIEIVHGTSGRKLNSHDVTAPVSKAKQEVSCYINYNVSMAPETLWRVEISNQVDGDTWKTVRNNVKLVHVSTSAVLLTTDVNLPDWGFLQKEVVTDRASTIEQSYLWNVEEHRYGQNDEIATALKSIDFLPLKPTEMSVWDKMWELQIRLFTSNMDVALEHKYKTTPFDWPLMGRNLAYWMDKQTNAQLHLLGNPVIWYTGSLAVIVCFGFLVFGMLRRRRQCYDVSEAKWSQLTAVSSVLLVGYLIHYFPYFLMARTMFIHSYLPALFYQMMLLAAVVDLLISLFKNPNVKLFCWMLVGLWSLCAIYSFSELSVFTYGTMALTRPEIDAKQWRESWDFLAHGNHP